MRYEPSSHILGIVYTNSLCTESRQTLQCDPAIVSEAAKHRVTGSAGVKQHSALASSKAADWLLSRTKHSSTGRGLVPLRFVNTSWRSKLLYLRADSFAVASFPHFEVQIENLTL